jgi:hypothetical protein
MCESNPETTSALCRSPPVKTTREVGRNRARDGFFRGQPEQDAEVIDPGNPWRCLRSIKWTKAMDGFVHV